MQGRVGRGGSLLSWGVKGELEGSEWRPWNGRSFDRKLGYLRDTADWRVSPVIFKSGNEGEYECHTS